MKSSYIHNGTAWSKLLAPFVHNGTSYKQANKVYTHDGTAWKLVYDTGYKKILSSGTYPGRYDGVVWSSGLAFINNTSGSENVYHFDGTSSTRLGSLSDTFYTYFEGVRNGADAIFVLGSTLLAYKKATYKTISRWNGASWVALPSVTINSITYTPGGATNLIPTAARDRANNNTVLFFSVTYYDTGIYDYKTAVCIYNAGTDSWEVTYITDGPYTVGWIHNFGGTLYAITNVSLFSKSGSTWTKVCSTPGINATSNHLTDDGSSLFLSGSTSAAQNIYKLSGGSFTSISSTRYGAAGFGGKLWVRDAYYSGSSWTSISLIGEGPGGYNTPFYDSFFINNGGTYYVMDRGQPYSSSDPLRDITDGTNYKASGGPVYRFYTYKIAQSSSVIYTLYFDVNLANPCVYEYDLAGQVSTW